MNTIIGRRAGALLALLAAFPASADDISRALADLTDAQTAMAYECLAEADPDTTGDDPSTALEDAMRACIEQAKQSKGVAAARVDAPPGAAALRAIDAGGHFYLGGVTEVGSELRLHPDGRFEWVLMYGALDQAASGRWRRDGHHVVLEAAPGASQAPTRLETFLAWNEAAERKVAYYRHQVASQQVLERCPFVGSEDYASAPAMAGDETPSEAELKDRAVRSAARLQLAVAAVEARAIAFVADAAEQRDASAVNAAMDEYRAARDEATQAHWAAGMEVADREPAFPAECRLPPAPGEDGVVEDLDDPSAWQGGVAVRVGDAESRRFLSDFDVTFRFADGTTERDLTDRGGWVVRPRRSAPLTTIEVRFPEGIDAPVFQLAVPAAQEGAIAVVDVDASTLNPPAFETMRLRIDGDGLVPTWPSGHERGRYAR